MRVFTKIEDYRVHLLNRLGQLKDTFPAKIVKGLAFSPLTDIRSFVHNYLLDENLLDVKTLQAQLETMRHFETLAIGVRERIDSLNAIEKLNKERVANRRKRISNTAIARLAEADTFLDQLKQLRLELDSFKLEYSREELRRDEISRALKFAQSALTDAEIALRTDQNAIREKELREKIAALNVELTILREKKKQADESLAHESADAQKLRAHLVADNLSIPAELDSFIHAPSTTSHTPLTTPHILLPILQSLANDFSREEILLSQKVNELRDEGSKLENEIRKLRTGDRDTSYETEAPNAARLRHLLRAELNLNADDVKYLCDELSIPDESWQDAVEGLLGFNRFTLLVPPEHYNAAMKVYRKHKDSIHGAALLDTEAILTHAPRPTSHATLSSEIITSNPAARAYVDLLLGNYVKCENIEDLREHRTAVTRDCFVRRNFTDSHLNPNTYRRWFIGERAAPRQIEQRQARLDEIAHEMISLNERTSELRERLALTRDKTRPFIELEHALEAVANLPERTMYHALLTKELDQLDLHSADTLKADVEKRRGELNQIQDEANDSSRKLGNLEAEIRKLEAESIPSVERSAAEKIQEQENFLALENADDETKSDIQKEYDKRRERQPLETILQNARRYENDYQNAEQRSRDKLREAKQAYSMRYDFGYDEADDDARYMTEREKLVSSELPQYEGQIAKQRVMAEQELVENFIHRSREQIEDARQQLGFLNTSLAALRFGGERFEFITSSSPALKQIYDMVMDSQQIMGDSLFESEFRQKHQEGWDLLFERLTSAHDDENIELRELQDYRNYLNYDIRIHYPNGDRALLSAINAKKSGGETTTPFYVAMAASFAQAYRLNQGRPSDTIRLAMFDEAFGKMDTARTASALKFMHDAGLQVLLATPPDKSGSLLPFVDSVCTVVRKENRSFVVEIDKSEMLKELEK